MALILAHRPPLRRAGPALLWAVAGFGVATIVFGLSTNPYLSFAMLLLTGALDNISVVVRATLVQVLTPDDDARAGLGGERDLHRIVERAGRVRVGDHRPVLRADRLGRGGGIGTILVVFAVAAFWPGVRPARLAARRRPGG